MPTNQDIYKEPSVVIFGAGITGLTVAHELVERGWTVTVVEPEIDPLNVEECAVGGLAKTQWSVYQPGPHKDEPADLRPMVPTVRLRADRAKGDDAIVKKLMEYRLEGDMTPEAAQAVLEPVSSKDLEGLLDYLLDRGSWLYLARVARRLTAIWPHVPDMCVRHRGSDSPSWPNLVAEVIVAHLKRLGASRGSSHLDPTKTPRVYSILDPTIAPRAWQVETDLVDRTPDSVSSPGPGIVPGEHGFRFFPALYRNLFDTLRRIPVRGEGQVFGDTFRTVYDNLVPTEANWLALDDEERRPGSATAKQNGVVRFPRRMRKSLRESFDALGDMYSELGYTIRDVELLKLRLFKYMTSCQRRRNEQYEGMSWSDFMGLSDLSPIARQDMERAPQLLAAMTAQQSDARTQGNLAIQLLLDPINADERVDSTLNAPTTFAWLGPWKEYLIAQGVTFVPGRLTDFEVPRGGVDIRPVVTEDDGLCPESVATAEYYVLAIPVQAWSEGGYALVERWRGARPAGAEKDHIDQLHDWLTRHVRPTAKPKDRSLYKGLTGMQFYMDADDLARSGHTLYMDTPWRLSAISQASFWNRRREAFDGYRGIVSVDIGSIDDHGDKGLPRSFRDTLRPAVHAAVWNQMEVCKPEEVPYRMYRIDEYIQYDTCGKMEKNLAPFLINGVGEWDDRPGWDRSCWISEEQQEPQFEDAEEPSSARYQLMPVFEGQGDQNAVKWVLAGTFMQTWTRATTMESANESGKHAVNTLLAHVKDRRARRSLLCRIWNPERYEHGDLRIWQELDRRLYEWDEREPLPHMVDILELDSISDALLEGELSQLVGACDIRGSRGGGES